MIQIHFRERCKMTASFTLDSFYSKLWADYIQMAPQAEKIYQLFKQDNPNVENDHVAFRTWDHPSMNIEKLETHFLSMGYQRFAPYEFKEKKLRAYGYIHSTQANAPRIFLSELKTNELSLASQAIIQKITQQIPEQAYKDISVFWRGPLWQKISWADYQVLANESEYAAWLAVIGIRVNHFTVSINSLKQPTTVAGVVERVEAAGFTVNSSGGKLKGGPSELLEQASTMADQIMVEFVDNNKVSKHQVPSCYYEFAKRYKDANGKLYQGFVAASADKIFESTNKK